jgi:hypothetical protein
MISGIALESAQQIIAFLTNARGCACIPGTLPSALRGNPPASDQEPWLLLFLSSLNAVMLVTGKLPHA